MTAASPTPGPDLVFAAFCTAGLWPGLGKRTAAELHAGRIAPCPDRCSSRGCRHPAICRAAEPKVVPPA